MTLTAIEAVRLKSSDKSSLTREEGVGTGTDVFFKLSHAPIISSPDIEVRINDITQVAGFTVDHSNGVVTFDNPPSLDDRIEFTYYWSVFSDDEIQYFIDEAVGDITTATAKVLLAIAADASKIAQRQSLAGGGGLGAVTIDTSVAARELRNTAVALLDQVKQLAGLESVVPAEGLTEPLWTEFNYREEIGQNIIRRS